MNQQRIAFVASEMLGLVRGGGLGTATTFLALALGRAGHKVTIILFGTLAGGEPHPYWVDLYRRYNVTFERLERSAVAVHPLEAQVGHDVARLLMREPPDVVIAQDAAGPAAHAIRLRHLGLAFPDTRFIAFCHGTSVWLSEAIQKLRLASMPLELELPERATLAMADAVVSPSAYMLGWLRNRGWELSARQTVIPLVTRTGALSTRPTRLRSELAPLTRISYFGRLDERKGLRIFLDGLGLVDPKLLAGLELSFLGEETKTWSADRVVAALATGVGRYFASIRIETALDQQEALEQLAEPGTLAVMPSLVDNSPNTVYECLELGIPFLTTNRGGTPEIIAPDDWPNALIEPTAAGVAGGLTLALTAGARARRPAHEPDAAVRAWLDLLDESATSRPDSGESVETITAIVTATATTDDPRDCIESLSKQSARVALDLIVVDARLKTTNETDPDEAARPARVIRARGASLVEARAFGVRHARGEWVLLLRPGDRPVPHMIESLVQAQRASGADVVTCGIRAIDDGSEVIRLYDGAPGGFGLLSNRFGTVALIRRELLLDETIATCGAELDPEWPLLASLSLRGASIVSIPEPLVERHSRPGNVHTSPVDALAVITAYERALPEAARSLARLAPAGGVKDIPGTPLSRPLSLARPASAALTLKGVRSLARRVGRRL